MIDLITLYKQLADLTAPLCGNCRVPHGCCDAVMGCELTKQFAKDYYDVDLQPNANAKNGLMFLGTHGCTVEPHLRPHCSRHHCDINHRGGFDNPQTTQRYFDLINQIEILEYQLYVDRRNSKESKLCRMSL